MNVDRSRFVGISLCAGVGMLDEAIKLAFPGTRTACFVEWEGYAQACLLARMEEASVECAPIWGDSLESFPADQFAGRIDFIAAGFPCQPHSLAGKRQGVADERWIWESIAEIIRTVGPRFVFLENVRGLLSSSAGTAFGRVLRDLAKLGFAVEWTMLRASEVGASHERARLFILAHSKGTMGDSDSKRDQQPNHKTGTIPRSDTRGSLGGPGSIVADTCGTGWEGSKLGRACDGERNGTDAHGSVAKLCGPFLFAPGPKSELWPDIIATMPHFAPAVEPGFRMLVDGLAHVVDESRINALCCTGNGVVALQAAAAFRHLAKRLGNGCGDYTFHLLPV